MIPSEIKLEEFNDCPGAQPIKDYLNEEKLHPYIEIVDLDHRLGSYFENDPATLVIAIIQGATEARTALAIGQIATHYQADEFHWKVVEGVFVVRLWWD